MALRSLSENHTVFGQILPKKLSIFEALAFNTIFEKKTLKLFEVHRIRFLTEDFS